MSTPVSLICSFLLLDAYYPVSQRRREAVPGIQRISLHPLTMLEATVAWGRETPETFPLLSPGASLGICLPVCFVPLVMHVGTQPALWLWILPLTLPLPPFMPCRRLAVTFWPWTTLCWQCGKQAGGKKSSHLEESRGILSPTEV